MACASRPAAADAVSPRCIQTNLCSRQTAAGQVETVVLDSAFVGIGPVGAELAPLVLASVAFGEVEPVDMEELQRVSFDGYVAGLADVGWSGDPSLTRLSYSASGMLRYAVGCVRLILPALLDSHARSRVEQVSGRSFEETVRLWGVIARSMASVATPGASARERTVTCARPQDVRDGDPHLPPDHPQVFRGAARPRGFLLFRGTGEPCPAPGWRWRVLVPVRRGVRNLATPAELNYVEPRRSSPHPQLWGAWVTFPS